jgi:hypothetical protein
VHKTSLKVSCISKIHYHTLFKLSVISVAPNSLVHSSAILLLTVRNLEARYLDGFRTHNIPTKFRKNRSSCSDAERGDTNTNTPNMMILQMNFLEDEKWAENRCLLQQIAVESKTHPTHNIPQRTLCTFISEQEHSVQYTRPQFELIIKLIIRLKLIHFSVLYVRVIINCGDLYPFYENWQCLFLYSFHHD